MTQTDCSGDLWPSGDGGMARLIREYDWSATPLGPIESWPQSRKTIVDMMLASEVIMAAPWGPEGFLLYNDAYARLLGPRGATAIGRPVFEALPELRELLEPQFAEVWSGRTLRVTDFLYPFVARRVEAGNPAIAVAPLPTFSISAGPWPGAAIVTSTSR